MQQKGQRLEIGPEAGAGLRRQQMMKDNKQKASITDVQIGGRAGPRVSKAVSPAISKNAQQ